MDGGSPKAAPAKRMRTPTSPDPIEIAMEAMADEPGEDNPARTLLVNQNRLVLRQIANERMGLVLKWLIALAVLAAVAVLAGMAWSARQDHSLVIEAFSVPADLAEQGSSGQAVASALQDKLAQLSAQTLGVAATPEVRQLSAAKVKVQIPQTGISLDDVNELLRQWLSHRTEVAGEVAHVTFGPDKGALALSVRVGAEPGVRFVQADGDLEALLQRAAEQVYGARAPKAYDNWLSQHDRTDEALAFAHRMVDRGDPAERSEGYNLLYALQQASIPLEQSLAYLRAGVRSRPTGGSSLINLFGPLERLGYHEEAFRNALAAEKVGANATASNQTGQELWPRLARSNAGRVTGDYRPNLEMICFLYDVSPCRADDVVATSLINPRGARAENSANRLSQLAGSLADAHDLTSAQRLAAAPRDAIATNSDSQRAQRAANWSVASVAIDRQREDWAAVLRDVEAWDAVAAPWPGLRAARGYRLWKSYALVKLGRAAEGQAEIAATPLDCYPCLVMRGRVAALAGDKAGAARWFAEARRQGPSLPMADTAWGEALLRSGDADGAIAHFEAAHKASPKFADPIEGWGEALLAKGDPAGAAARFQAAEALTPRWGRLHLKWGEALAKEGKAPEGRAQLRAAAALALTPDEQAELARLH